MSSAPARGGADPRRRPARQRSGSAARGSSSRPGPGRRAAARPRRPRGCARAASDGVVGDGLAGGGDAALVDAGAGDDPAPRSRRAARRSPSLPHHGRRQGVATPETTAPRRRRRRRPARRSSVGWRRAQAWAASRSVEHARLDVVEGAADHPRQRLARAGVDERRGRRSACRASSVSRQRTGRDERRRELVADPVGRGAEEVGEDAREDGRLWRLDLDLAERLAERAPRPAASPAVWKAPRTASADRAQPVGLRRGRRWRPSASGGPATTSWVGPLSLAITVPPAVGGARGRGRRRRAAPASRRAAPPAASCIRRPRRTAMRTASAGAIAPAAASALSSPSEWPAKNAARGGRRAVQPARLAQRIAGWA